MSEAALSLGRERLAQVRHGAVVVTTAPAIFRVEGPGALACLQGLLSNDLDRPGDHALVYGAFLTPKGMIVADYWVLRQPDALTLVGSPEGHAATLELFARRLPPRLARVTDRTNEARAVWLLGEESGPLLRRVGCRLPEAGRVTAIDTAGGPILLGLAPAPAAAVPAEEMGPAAPVVGLAVGAEPAIGALVGRLVTAGATEGGDHDLRAARLIAGWPTLGAEIDERTLPQEVRYDEIGGLSYTKGCYVGQETVARLHFRGHTNRELRGLYWEGTAPLNDATIVWQEKPVGTVHSTLALDDRRLGLGILRREVEAGAAVVAGGQPARVVLLPFGAAELDG